MQTLCEKFQEIQVRNKDTFLKMLEEREQHWKQQRNDMLKAQQTTLSSTPFIHPTAMRNTKQFL